MVRQLRRDPLRKPAIVGVYSRFRRFMFFVNIGLVAMCVLVFGWGWATQQVLLVDWHGQSRLAPFAELAVPLPYFLILFGAWTIYYDAERALHRTTILGPVDRSFWSRAGYFLHHLRQFGLLVMLPVMLFVTQQSIARFLPETARSDWYRIASVAMIPVLILFMPLLIKPILGLKTMPAGPVRDRLESDGEAAALPLHRLPPVADARRIGQRDDRRAVAAHPLRHLHRPHPRRAAAGRTRRGVRPRGGAREARPHLALRGLPHAQHDGSLAACSS